MWNCIRPGVLQVQTPGPALRRGLQQRRPALAGVTRDLVKVWDAQTGQDLLRLQSAPPPSCDRRSTPAWRSAPTG